MNISSTYLFAATILGSITLLGIGCGTSDLAVDTDTNTLRGSDAQGNTFVAGEGATIPANFPSDFPRYPNAKTTLAYTESNGQTGSLAQETPDPLEQVQPRIEQLMESQGYTKTNTLASPGIVILAYKKGTFVFQINISQQEGKTMIQSGRAQQQQEN